MAGKMITGKDTFLLWGTGRFGNLLPEFFPDLPVKAYIDSDTKKHNTKVNGLSVYSYEDAIKKYPDAKIVLSLIRVNPLRVFLADKGFMEHKDFYTIHDFVPMYAWGVHNLLIPFTTFIPTNNTCTQNCDGCLVYVPYAQGKVVRPFEEMKQDVDSVFRRIDKTMIFCTSSGEQLLHPQIVDLWEYISSKYSHQYHQLVIVTNSSVLPSDKDFVRIKKCGNIIFSLSNYADRLSEQGISLGKMINKLKEYKIQYFINITADDEQWDDLGDPREKKELPEEELTQRYNRCSVTPGGVFDKKYFSCMQEAWAHLNVNTPLYGDDFYDLENENDKEKLIDIVLRQPQRGYLEFCKHCNGRIYSG